MSKKALIVLAVLFIFTLSISASDIISDKNDQSIQKRNLQSVTRINLPDLILEKIETQSEPYGTDQVRVTISYWVYNDSTADSSCCPTDAGKKAWTDDPATNLFYNFRIEVRSYPDGRFGQLGGMPLTLTRAKERQKFTAVDIVKKGARREYRITADPSNWIREKKEDNNRKTQIWPIRVRR